MRSDKKGRKKFQTPIPFILVPGKKIRKKRAKKFKILKNLFQAIFLAKTGEKGLERVKKMLFPNSVHTRPGQENSEKSSKKIQKIKKPLSEFIFSLNEMRQVKKGKKKFYSRMPFILDPAKKIPKKIVKKFKKFKNHFPTLFLPKTG